MPRGVANSYYGDWCYCDTMYNGYIFKVPNRIFCKTLKQLTNNIIFSFNQISAQYNHKYALLQIFCEVVDFYKLRQQVNSWNGGIDLLVNSVPLRCCFYLTSFLYWFHFLRLIKFWYLGHYLCSRKKLCNWLYFYFDSPFVGLFFL